MYDFLSEHLFLSPVNIYALRANSKFNPINGTKMQAVSAWIQAVFAMQSLQIKPLVPWLWLANPQCVENLWKSQEDQLAKQQWFLFSQLLNLFYKKLR